MTIFEMTATFGPLDGQTLRLEPGMNWIVAPNEWGKSTWCAFLVAMFYGIDTRERSGKDGLADKEHYAPWSGKPMEGRIRLEYQGRDITIARRTRGRIPLGEFAAFETMTGLPVRELTADNCGQTLLGVEKSVFKRSGFITLKDMPVTNDEALRRRLNSLVTTGDESAQADHLAQKLKELKNRCLYHRSGLIPECRERLEELKGELNRRSGLDAQLIMVQGKEKDCKEALQKLELHSRWLDYSRNASDAKRLSQALEADRKARERYARCQQTCATHLSRQELEARLVVQQPAKTRRPGWLLLLLAVLLLGCAGVLACLDRWDYGALLLPVAAVLAIAGVVMQSKYNQWEKALALQTRQREGWLQELSDWDDLERSKLEAEQARRYVRTLRELVRSVPAPEERDPLELDEEQTRQAIRDAQDQLGRQRQLRGEILGKMEHLPQKTAIECQISQTQHRLRELECTYTALGYAQKALEEATIELQKRFAPRIIRRAEAFLSRLTMGKYTHLQLSQELNLSASAENEAMSRSQLWRSDGTADQIYLALRLAVWEALMSGGPLVIDDALVRFDTARMDAAEKLLRELSKEHQIIVFSCR